MLSPRLTSHLHIVNCHVYDSRVIEGFHCGLFFRVAVREDSRMLAICLIGVHPGSFAIRHRLEVVLVAGLAAAQTTSL